MSGAAGVPLRVVLTGSEGYLGPLVAERLLEDGHWVQGIDTGFYADTWLGRGPRRRPAVLRADVRDLDVDDLRGADAVVHLAELSNDPLGQMARDVTEEINHQGTVRLAELARKADVPRFVHMSSCSVYGVAADDVVDETSPTNPQTAYAECKLAVENDVGAMADDVFAPTFLRNATAYGMSPRLRVDLVVNNLVAVAHTRGVIAMTSDGTPWRPLVHGADIARAIGAVLTQPLDRVRGEVVNVGSDADNHRVRDIAEAVAEAYPGCEVTFGDLGGDTRSYRVSFAKLGRLLPGFACEWDIRRGIAELRDAFTAVGFDETAFGSRHFTRLAQIEHLRATGQLDDDLRWTTT